MAKKKSEKDVLIVRDEKTGEISVVAGLDADGSPKRTPAKAENAQSFLQFDRHGDVLDNFFKNFFRQCKEPSRFGFYRVAADQADKLMEVMKDLLKDPEANKELFAPHKVDTYSRVDSPTKYRLSTDQVPIKHRLSVCIDENTGNMELSVKEMSLRCILNSRVILKQIRSFLPAGKGKQLGRIDN